MHWSIIILMILSLACSKKEAPAPAEPEQAAETETPPSDEGAEPTADPAEELRGDTPAVGAPPVVKILELGEEPRRPLRWNVKPGFEQKVSVNVDYSADAVIGLMKTPPRGYRVSYDLTVQARMVEDDGTVRVGFKVDSARVGPWPIADVKAERTLQMPHTGTYKLGPRGQMSETEISVPPNAKVSPEIIDHLRWVLIQMTPTFPERPVGPGAKWTVHEGISQSGIHVNQLTTMELVKVKDGVVELAQSLQQSAAPQPFQNPGNPQKMSLSTLKGEAGGSFTWHLTELAPRAAKLDSKVVKGVNVPHATAGRVPVIMGAQRAVKVTER